MVFYHTVLVTPPLKFIVYMHPGRVRALGVATGVLEGIRYHWEPFGSGIRGLTVNHTPVYPSSPAGGSRALVGFLL